MSQGNEEPCSCHSGEPYASCCQPYHAGRREPESPPRVLRTRFAAFARSDAAYLHRTVVGVEVDLAELKASLAKESKVRRYRSFRILDERVDEASGSAEMLYVVEIRRRGKDLSFVEHGFFARTGPEAWAYVGGQTFAVPKRRGELDGWSLATLAQRGG